MATVKELRQMAKDKGIKGYSNMKKAELETLLSAKSEQCRKTIPGDGSCIGSFMFCAAMACAMRIISETEYALLAGEMEVAQSDEDLSPKAKKIIQKIPSVFQIRHEGCKGLIIKYPLEFVKGLEDKDLVVTEGARKFAAVDWAEAPLEVCNYLKRKENWVALNPQFIQALKFENPNALIPIVDFWFNKLNESVNDIAKAQEFHGVISSVDSESDVNSNLVAALRNSADLLDDFQVIAWRKTQYEKFIADMKVGRILVPGQYTYMVCDPAYMLNSIYGLSLDALKSGEYWFNDFEGYAAGFRSPLIAPFEAQKFNCVAREDYWFYKDIVVFNGYDGAWENMGGGDFDGDTMCIVPDNTDLGKIVVDGVAQYDYVVFEEGLSAVKEEFSWENLAKFNAKVAKRDRTGEITNYASRALDIYNHLNAAIYFAKLRDCKGISLVHPAQVTEPGEMKPSIIEVEGNKYFQILGFVYAEEKDGRVRYDQNGIFGLKTFEEIEEIANDFLAKVEYLRLMQGREIDSAKTGVAAEGTSGLDFVDSVKIKFTSQALITRTKHLKRNVSSFAELNKYQSLSPLARVHDYVERQSLDFMERFNNGSDKVALLLKLLRETEAEQLKMTIQVEDSEPITLINYLKQRKAAYGANMSAIFKADELIGEDGDTKERRMAINSLKETEIETLLGIAEALNISAEVIAVACYIATYEDKNGNFDRGLSYAWLLFNELLSVFTRNNKKFELYRLPAYAEEGYIINGTMYLNGKKYASMPEASEMEYLPIQIINGKKYALIHKISDLVVPVKKTDDMIGKTFVLDRISGFKYNASMTKENWKNIVRENGYTFQIDLDDNSRLCTFSNGLATAAIKANVETADLVGYTVKVTSIGSETENTIANVMVTVIG